MTVSVIERYVMETIKRDIELLNLHGADYFEIVGLECPLSAKLYGQKFYGVADRIDRIGDSQFIRMVDYKSGKDDPSVLATDQKNAEKMAKLIFGEETSTSKKVKDFLQNPER